MRLGHGPEGTTARRWATIAPAHHRTDPLPSFDVVSELNAHEVANALDQANRPTESELFHEITRITAASREG